jgi:acyl carrier protein
VVRTIAALWAELLEADEPAPAADFFDEGGNSLLAAQLAARISAEFGVELPLAEVYRTRTPHALAAAVARLS